MTARKCRRLDDFATYRIACGCSVIVRNVRYEISVGDRKAHISEVAAASPAMVEEAYRRLEES